MKGNMKIHTINPQTGKKEPVNKYQKPIALFARHLKMCCKKGDFVVDLTAGTGTTAVSPAQGLPRDEVMRDSWTCTRFLNDVLALS